jgi:hypothetical protein
MKKSIIFLGVNDLQVLAINSAKNLGLIVVGFDRNVNAKGQSYCDFFFNIDCNDISKVYSATTSLHLTVIGVWANNDILISSRIILSNLFNIVDSDLKIAIKLLNKREFKGLVNSKDYLISHADINNEQEAIKFGFPLILKPVVGSGSQGIKIFSNLDHLLSANLNFPFFVEKFIEGYELGINAFISENSTIQLGGVYRYFDQANHYVPIGTITFYEDEILNKSFAVLEDFLKEVGYQGMVKADILIDKLSNVYLIEASSRFHGEIDTGHVFKYIDYDLPRKYFEYLLNGSFNTTAFNCKVHYGYISLFINDLDLCPEYNLSLMPLGFFMDIEILQYYPHRYPADKINKNPLSTRDIVVFSFFKSRKLLDDKTFKLIYEQLNREFNKVFCHLPEKSN